MLDAGLCSRLGLFVVPNFLDAEFCSRLRAEMDAASDCRIVNVAPALKPQAETAGGDPLVVAEDGRKTDLVPVSSSAEQLVRERLHAVMPMIARHYDVRLASCTTLRFLRYNQGDCFKLHVDSGRYEGAGEEVENRKVSVTVFLNGQATDSDPAGYQGGHLTFYGLLHQPGWETVGLPLSGKTGLLIAFPVDVPHEVRTITHGKRYTVVGRFS